MPISNRNKYMYRLKDYCRFNKLKPTEQQTEITLSCLRCGDVNVYRLQVGVIWLRSFSLRTKS